MSENLPIGALARVADVLEAMDVEYYIGGSVASVLFGQPRSTIDVDLIANLRAEDVSALAAQLDDAYYLERASILDAVRRQRTFNIIHLESMYKVDVFPINDRPYDQVARTRVVRSRLTEDDPRVYPIASPEDVILNKLEWYRDGSMVSDRQWQDVLGILRVRGDALDWEYMSAGRRHLVSRRSSVPRATKRDAATSHRITSSKCITFQITHPARACA